MSSVCDEITPISGAKLPCNPKMELFKPFLTNTESPVLSENIGHIGSIISI
jgi:hypothetical protein